MDMSVFSHRYMQLKHVYGFIGANHCEPSSLSLSLVPVERHIARVHGLGGTSLLSAVRSLTSYNTSSRDESDTESELD